MGYPNRENNYGDMSSSGYAGAPAPEPTGRIDFSSAKAVEKQNLGLRDILVYNQERIKELDATVEDLFSKTTPISYRGPTEAAPTPQQTTPPYMQTPLNEALMSQNFQLQGIIDRLRYIIRDMSI